jgi:hypothetical protein
MDAQEPHSSDDISGSNLAVTPEYLQQQRKALGDFLNMSLEATHQANAFDNVEKIALTLKEHTFDSLEKENLEDLLADLIQLKETTPSLVARVDSAQAPQASSSEKSTNLKANLAQKRGKRGLLFILPYIMKRDALMRISPMLSLLLAQQAREPTILSYEGTSPTSLFLPIFLSILVA